MPSKWEKNIIIGDFTLHFAIHSAYVDHPAQNHIQTLANKYIPFSVVCDIRLSLI